MPIPQPSDTALHDTTDTRASITAWEARRSSANYPLNDAILASIVQLQLGRIARRVEDHHKIPFTYDDSAVKLIVSRCTEVESGGRMIDAILTNTVLPEISHEFLRRTMEGMTLKSIRLNASDGRFDYQFD